jgi:hypothetical protein
MIKTVRSSSCCGGTIKNFIHILAQGAVKSSADQKRFESEFFANFFAIKTFLRLLVGKAGQRVLYNEKF